MRQLIHNLKITCEKQVDNNNIVHLTNKFKVQCSNLHKQGALHLIVFLRSLNHSHSNNTLSTGGGGVKKHIRCSIVNKGIFVFLG